jgi:hypothetical protein
MTTLQEEIESTDEAFVSALTPKSLDSVELKPYSLMRQVVAIELTGVGSTALQEAIFIIWVCTLEPAAAIATISSKESKTQAQLDAFAWAEQHGVTIMNAGPILTIYRRLMGELKVSSKVRSADEEPLPKNDGALPG